MIAYKLMRVRKDGSLGPLFINKSQRIEVGKRYIAEQHDTPGFKSRFGWHCCARPYAPHLSKRDRVWAKVSISVIANHIRPESQGGVWYTARSMRVLYTFPCGDGDAI